MQLLTALPPCTALLSFEAPFHGAFLAVKPSEVELLHPGDCLIVAQLVDDVICVHIESQSTQQHNMREQ